jgi:hypothetical protein
MTPIKTWALGFFMLCLQTTNAQQISTTSQRSIIDTAISLLHRNYIFPDRIRAIETGINTAWRNGRYKQSSELSGFLDLLNADLESFGKDHHLDVFYGPARVAQIRAEARNESSNNKPVVTEGWLKQMRYENFRLRKLERLDGNIGYLKFLNFPPLDAARTSIDAAMTFLTYSDALVVDLRGNGGGSAETMNYLLGYFLTDSTPISAYRYLDGSVVHTIVPAVAGVRKFAAAVPVYILTGSGSSSAAEGFAYTLQQYGRAKTVGQQTRGEGNPGRLFAVTDSLYMMIPTAEAINAVSKKSIDGIGVTPDISSREDQALTAALIEANQHLAHSAVDPQQKALYSWQIPFLENEMHPAALPDSIARNLVGMYEGGRKILIEGGRLLYVNAAGERDELSYLGGGIFQSASRNQMRLSASTDPKKPGVTWTWMDGGTQWISRIINQGKQ